MQQSSVIVESVVKYLTLLISATTEIFAFWCTTRARLLNQIKCLTEWLQPQGSTRGLALHRVAMRCMDRRSAAQTAASALRLEGKPWLASVMRLEDGCSTHSGAWERGTQMIMLWFLRIIAHQS